jgi:hypothetical protein
LILATIACSAYAQDEEGPGVTLNRLPKTDSVWAVLMPGMGSMRVRVPHVSDGTVLACFRERNQQALECFYRNNETGQVIIRHVQSSMTGV